MTHASESGHWYDAKTGAPVYEVPRADGKGTRPTTITDARRLGLVPGATTIIKCAAAPGLEIWKQKQVLLSALTLQRINGEPEPDYLDRIMSDSREQSRKAADRGTAIHAAIQGHYEGQVPSEDMWPYVKSASAAVYQWFGLGLWIPEDSFAHPLGFGGKADLYHPVNNIVLDIKTKEFNKHDGKKLSWDEHCIQLAAYRVGLAMPTARCANVFVSTSVPGLATVIEWSEQELIRGWKMFLALLDYWKIRNKFHVIERRDVVGTRPGTGHENAYGVENG